MRSEINWLPRKRMPRFGVHVSSGGVMYLLGMILIGLVGINADVNLLMILLGIGFGAWVVSAAFNWISLRKMGVERTIPDVLVAGQPCFIRYSVSNHRRWGYSRGLHVVDVVDPQSPMPPPESFIAALGPRETRVVDVPALAMRRGRIVFDRIALATRFPFGLFTKYAAFSRPQEAIVFPRLGRLNVSLRILTQPSAIGGGEGSASSAVGDEEFYGVREYRAGDNPRRIHWRRSARTGQLVVREMSRSRSVQIWCVVHANLRPKDPAAEARLESAISCAATVICDALERGAKVGMLCNGDPLLVLPPGGGRAHRPRLLRELAVCARIENDSLADHVARQSWPARWRGPCLLFGAYDDADMHAAQRSLNRALGPTTLCVPGTPYFESLFSMQDEDVASAVGALANSRLPFQALRPEGR